MDEDLLRYDMIVENALRGVVRTALDQVASLGLPDGHSFYITFMTQLPGVSIPDHMVAEYPEEMTIVLEHQFWDLTVSGDRFEVTLSFNRQHEHLSIPFSAVTSFADPSVHFGLKFEIADGADIAMVGQDEAALGELSIQEPHANNDASDENEGNGENETKEEDRAKMGEVVNLDTFRNK